MKKNLEKPLFYKVMLNVLLLCFLGNPSLGFAANSIGNEEKTEKSAQQKSISGTVKDEEGIPIPGVYVSIKGTKKGTISDFDGKFEIKTTANATLVFKYLGYETQEVLVGNNSTLNVVMKINTSELDEVVVVGYGTQAKGDLTGSVSVVKGDDIVARSNTNVSNALQGAVAGVTVTRGGAAPGSGNTIRIRGITTLQGSNSPLILVDNVPVGSINDVNADQIESISVLKDGASSSIYGSRAAAGVILITTKQAKAGKFTASYSGEYIVNQPTQIRETVDVIRYHEMWNERAWNDTGNDPSQEFSQYDEAYINDYLSNHETDPDLFPNTDWKSLLLKDQATAHRHSINISAGTNKIKTIANFGFEEQGALYDYRDWKRITGRINNNLKINDKFGADFNLAFKFTEDNQPIFNPTNIAIEASPIYPAIWTNGNIAEGKQGNNPYAKLHQGGFSRDLDYLFYGKFGVHYNIFKSLKLSLNVAPRLNLGKSKRFNKAVPYWDADNDNQDGTPSGYVDGHDIAQISLNENRVTNITVTSQALLNYDQSFGKHNLGAVLGYEEFNAENDGFRMQGNQYIDNNYPSIILAPLGQIVDNGSNFTELAYRSMFSRVTYDYNKKYLLQASVRRDGSSRFASNYRYGNFPSVSAGWVLSKEKFMEPLSNTISFLKLRASYGSLGNDRIGSNYLYQANMQFSDVLLTSGNDMSIVRSAGQVQLAIEDITWETTNTMNLGFDMYMFNNKLSLTGDYFVKDTQDMLLGLSLLRVVGYPDPDYNVGSMTTKGWEGTITWRDNIGDFKYSVSANAFDSKSIIDDIDGKVLFSGNVTNREGEEFNSFFGLQSDGIYQTQEEIDNSAVTSSNLAPGDIKYKDISGPNGEPDGVINEYDETLLGGSRPRYQYGGNINMSYKNFDFGLSFQGVGSNKQFIGSTYLLPFKSGWLSPPKEYDGNYWSVYNTPEQNLNAKYPRLSESSRGNNFRFSDYYLKDASYLRIKNITLGYTLPKRVLGNLGISKFRIYASGNDLFTFSNLPQGMDPEAGTGYLITKSYILGVKFNF